MCRMYDPTTGRFLQEDSYTGKTNDPLSLNVYTYCENEPLIYNDPTGHILANVVGAIAGAVIGGIIGGVSSYLKTGKVSLKSVLVGAVIGGVVGFGLGCLAGAIFADGIGAGVGDVVAGASAAASSASTAACSVSGLMANIPIGKFLMDKPNTAFGLFQTAVDVKNKNYKQAAIDLVSAGLSNKMESGPSNPKEPVINEDIPKDPMALPASKQQLALPAGKSNPNTAIVPYDEGFAESQMEINKAANVDLNATSDGTIVKADDYITDSTGILPSEVGKTPKFGENDLVYGPSSGGKLRQLQESAGGRLLTDIGGPASGQSWTQFSIQTMESQVKSNGMIRFDLTNMGDAKEITNVLQGTGQYADTVTGAELRYIQQNWSTFSGNVKFYLNGSEVEKPW